MEASAVRALVERFYTEMWNPWDEDLAREILSPTVDFRGSVGLHVTGHEGFIGYMRTIRRAFPDFHNEIVELVAEDGKAAARLRYTGTHRGELLGHPPTGRSVSYSGAAFFTIDGPRIASVWVLGDLAGLMRQIDAAP